ncbi:hypothetical protein [Dialister hominis]|uniref:hypothetical protein n=2 Tax=Dialister hominis TaxID=2582419 RepID=UPI00307AA287
METSMNRRSHFLPVILLAVISLMALLFAGCGSESSSRESKSEPNPYAEFKDLYKTDPLNRKYAYYYTNEKLGNIFTKERKELAAFDPAKYNKVNIAWHSVDGHKFWQITRKDSLNYYRGPIKNNKPDGIGVIYWKDHPYYIAHFKDGSMEGYGQEIREGSFSLPNYSKYSVPGRMPLHGLFQFEKTDIFKVSPAVYRGYYMSYEGYYKNNERNGEGISYNYENIKYLLQLAEANARTKFISNEAERKEVAAFDEKKGKEIPVQEVAIVYGSQWQVSTNPAARIKYRGEVQNGKPEGLGILYSDGKPFYKGHFKNGKYDGYGQYFDRMTFDLENYTKYSRPGSVTPLRGLFTYEKASEISFTGYALRYEGMYKDGLPHGDGILYAYGKMIPALKEIDQKALAEMKSNMDKRRRSLSIADYTRMNDQHRVLRVQYEAKVMDYLNTWQKAHPLAKITIPEGFALADALETYDMPAYVRDHHMNEEIGKKLLEIQREYQDALVKEGLEYPTVSLVNDEVEKLFVHIPFIVGTFSGPNYVEKGTEYSYLGNKLFEGEFQGLSWYQGKQFFTDGTVQYEGYFNDRNEYNWRGTLYDSYGNIVYDGKWKDGTYHAK